MNTVERVLKILALTVVGVIALVVAALIGVKVYLNDERLAVLVTEQLNANFAGHFQVREIRWSLPFRFAIADVVIDDPAGRPAIRANRVEATLRWRAFFANTIGIDDIAGHGLDVRLLAMPDDASALGLVEAFSPKTPPTTPPKDSTGPGFDLDFHARSLDRVEFTFDDNDIRIVVYGGHLESVTWGMEGNVMHIDGHVQAARLETKLPSLRYDGGPVDLHANTVDVDMGPSGIPSDITVTAKDVSLRLAELAMSARGDIRIPQNDPLPQGTVELDARLPLSHPLLQNFINDALETTRPTRGQVTVQALTKRDGAVTDVDITLHGDGAVVAGLPFDQLAAKAKLEADRIDIERALVAVDGGSATASGELTLTQPMAHDLTLDLDDFPLANILNALTDGIPAPRRLSGHIHAHGAALAQIDSHVEGQLQADGFPVELAGTPDPLHLEIEADVNAGRADIARFIAFGDGARLDLQGRIPFDTKGAVDAQLTLTHKSPNTTLAAAGADAPISIHELSLTAKAKGTRTSLVADALLDATGVEAQGYGPASIHVPVQVAQGTAHVEGATISLEKGAIELAGSVGVLDERGRIREAMPLQASVKAHDVELAQLTDKRGSGVLELDGHSDGTVQAPRGTVRVGVRDLSAHGVSFDKAAAVVNLTPSVVELAELTLDPKTGGDLQARGTYTVATHAIDAELDVRDLPLTAVLALTAPDVPLRGTIASRMHVTGTTQEPQVSGNVTISELVTGSTALGTLTLDVDREKSTAELTLHAKAALDGPLGIANVDAHIAPKTKKLDATIAVDRVGIAKALAAAGTSLPLDGLFGMNAEVHGALPYPEVVGELRFTELRIGGEVPETNTITMKLSSDATDASYLANVEFGRMLSASAHIWPASKPGLVAEVNAHFEELRISAFSQNLVSRGFDVMLSGETKMRYAAPKTLNGSLTLNWLDITIQKQHFVLTHYAVITLDGANIDVPRLDFEGGGSTLTAEGSIRDKRLTASVNGDLNLAMIAPLVTFISEPSGTLHLEASASGTTDKPTFQGKVSVAQEVRGRPRGLPQELILKSGGITLANDSVIIDTLSGQLDDGRFEVSGRIGLNGLKPNRYDVRINGQKLTFRTRELQLEADAKLQLTGTGMVPDVKGNVVVVTGRYLKKFALKDFNFIGKEPDTSSPLSQTAPFLSEMDLDIHATNSEDIEVKVDASAFAISLPLQLDLRLQGTPLNPSVGGRISAQAGSIKFPEATLTVQETLVTFAPGLPPADGANLTLVAEGEVPSNGEDSTADEVYLVSMTLSGTLAELQFDLSASPGLDRNQTLALLITGKAGFDQVFYGSGTATASGNSTSPEVDAAIALAGAGVTGPLTGFVENQLEDRINLKVDLSASFTSDQVRVTARKELTPRLRLEGSVQRALQASGSNLNVATATFVLGNRWFLQAIAQAAQNNSTSTDSSVTRPRSDSRLEMKYRLVGD